MTERGTVPQRTARWMMREALRRNLVPGDRVASEPTLMGYFDVSRGSLREALRVLAFLGVIEVRSGPGGGVRMAMPGARVVASALAAALQFRASTLHTVVEARAMAESPLAGRAATHRKDDDLAALEACTAQMEASIGTDGFVGPDQRFPELVAAAAGNEAMSLVVCALTRIARTAQPQYDTVTQRRLARERTAIVRAIGARDEQAARERTAALYAGVLDGVMTSEDLAARVVWADVDELMTDEPGTDKRKDGTWTLT